MYHHPENTLPALQSAIDAGACCVEFDIQFSSDRVPILFHDFTLKRITDKQGTVTDYSANEITKIHANHPSRLANARISATIPTLAETVDLLNSTPKIKVFVEVKRHSIDHFGVTACIDRLVHTLSRANFPWIMISFREDTLFYAKQRYDVPIGWILRQYSKHSRKIAKKLCPEFIFCNILRLPIKREPLWPGPWRWVTYDITDVNYALELLNQGIDMVETSCVTKMLGTSQFKR